MKRKSLHGKVHVWRMTEEQRLEYIKKYPIRHAETPKNKRYIEHDREHTRWGFSGF